MINKLKQHSLSFWYLNIMIVLFILIPKFLSFFDNIPLRVGLMALFPIIVIYDYFKNNIKFNKTNTTRMEIILYIILILSMIPSLFVSYNLITSLYTIVKFLLFFIIFYLVTRLDYTDEEQKILFKTLIIATIITVVYSIVDYIFDINLFKLSNFMYPGMKGRIRSTFFNSCYYASYLNLIFTFLLYKLCISKDSKNIIMYILIITATFLAFLFCFTRSATLIFIVLFLMCLILFRKIIFNYKLIIVIVLVISTSSLMPGGTVFLSKTMNDGKLFISNIVGFLPDMSYSEEEVDAESEFEDPSLQQREAFAKTAKDIALDKPLTGVGVGTYLDYLDSVEFAEKYPEYKWNKIPPHSSLLLMLSESGFISATALVLFIILVLYKFGSIILIKWKEIDKTYYYASIGFIISSGFAAVSLLSENTMYDTQIFPLYLIIIGILFNICSKDIPNFRDRLGIKYVFNDFLNLFRKENKELTLPNKRVVFISSTGGHFNELTQLSPLFEKYDSYIITERTKSAKNLKKKYKHIYFLVYGTKEKWWIYIFKFIYNFIKSLILYIKINPHVIVTTGAHTSVSMCYIGKLFGSKIIFIESFANSDTKTLSGSLVYPIADTFIVQWESMLKYYPKAILGGWIY